MYNTNVIYIYINKPTGSLLGRLMKGDFRKPNTNIILFLRIWTIT